MNSSIPHITICLCTLQRTGLLKRLLGDIQHLETKGLFTYSVVVADNDAAGSARAVVQECAANSPLKIEYVLEPRRSISHARNRSLEPATGEYIAFIDDDEYPSPDWLIQHYLALTKHQVAGVFGPVRPAYDPATPAWVKRAGFYERPEHPTGFPMPWEECRTGNVLVKRSVTKEVNPVFRFEFGAGSSDNDLFRRLMELGHEFVWCNEAIVYECVPEGRCRRGFLIRRALLRGGLSLRYDKGRSLSIAKACVAVPLYILALPFLLIAGHHLFMRYLVRLSDHLGRLLALFRIHPVQTRDMQ